MGAVSDHRPVFLSCAIGIAEPKKPGEEEEEDEGDPQTLIS
jgi:hypothetical protein